MNKFNKLLILPVLLLCACSKKDIVYKKINLFGEDVELKNPFYRKNNVIFCDVAEMSSYFGATATFPEQDYAMTMIEYNEILITFSSKKNIATKANVLKETSIEYTLEATPLKKDKGLDVPVNDLVKIFDYKYTLAEDVYIISR